MIIIRRGGVAWTWAGVRRAVMGDGEGRREVSGIIVIIVIIVVEGRREV